MKRIGKAVLVLAAIVALAGCHHQARPLRSASEAAGANVSLSKSAVAPPVARSSCTKPTPTTARGFAAMFAALDPREWGAADVSISEPLADGTGRSVWLYGDTFSEGRFVHSTAIVQDGGCLHVSHGGAQLIPNQDAHHIYWIETAIAGVPNSDPTYPTAKLWIEVRAITLTGTCPWCFKDGGRSRWASASVSDAGDVTFLGWQSDPVNCCAKTYPHSSGGKSPVDQLLTVIGPHHFTYFPQWHPEFKLTSGRRLYTTCQNFDDGKLHPLADYRPIFTER